MYYISKERYIFTLFTESENNMKLKKLYAKKVIFDLYFSIVQISTNNAFGNLRVGKHLDNIPLEGTASQIFYLSLGSNFM